MLSRSERGPSSANHSNIGQGLIGDSPSRQAAAIGAFDQRVDIADMPAIGGVDMLQFGPADRCRDRRARTRPREGRRKGSCADPATCLKQRYDPA